MNKYYAHDLQRHVHAKDFEDQTLEKHASTLAAAIKSRDDRGLQSEAFSTVIEMAWELTKANHRRLRFHKTGVNYSQTVFGTLFEIAVLAESLNKKGVANFNVVAEGAIYLGFELCILPLSLNEPSPLIAYHDLNEISFEHWMVMQFACRQEAVRWPNLYEPIEAHELFYNQLDEPRDVIWESAQLIFDPVHFRNRVRDNYMRCDACIKETIEKNLSPRQLLLQINHKDSEKNILTEQRQREIARNVDLPMLVAPPQNKEQAFGSHHDVIAVRTDSTFDHPRESSIYTTLEELALKLSGI